MARARNIKPGFFTNEDLADCSVVARLLFIGMWTLADRDGFLEDRPKRIRCQVFPYDNLEIEELLTELLERGFIQRLSNGIVNVIWIPGFVKNQRPHPDEKASAFAADFAEAIKSQNQPRDLTATCALPSSSLNAECLNPDSLKAESPKAGPRKTTADAADGSPSNVEQVRQVFEHYRKHHPRSQNPAKGSKEWRNVAARLKEGYSVSDLCKAIDGNHLSPHHCGDNDTGTKYHSLELIFRESSKTAGFIEIAYHPPPVGLNQKNRRTASAAERFVQREMGNDDANSRLREVCDSDRRDV